MIIGASNAVNFTDGLDGLATVPVMIAAGAFGLIAYLVGNFVFADYLQLHYVPGVGEVGVFCAAMVGSCLGFLWYNAPPAKIFMGDTGSLALGGGAGRRRGGHQARDRAGHRRRPVRARERLGDGPGRYVQATGKRVFLMAPIHHHFERLGWAGVDGGHPLLDRRHDAGHGRPRHLEAAIGEGGTIMIPVRGFEGKRVAVFGLGRTGPGRGARAARPAAPRPSLWDEKPAARELAAAEGFALVDLRTIDWSSLAALMLSPGVPLTHPQPHWTVEMARAAGVEILGDIELFARTVNAAPDVQAAQGGGHHRHQRQVDDHGPLGPHADRRPGATPASAATSATACSAWTTCTAGRSMCWRSPPTSST